MQLKNIIVLFAIFITSSTLNLPPEFEKCKRSDPNINVCLKNAIQNCLPFLAKGLPEFNFDSIEPIKVPSLTIGEGTGAVHVVQNYKNVEIHNLQTATVENIQSVITDNEFKLVIEAHVSDTLLEAEYSLNGNILVFPITGNGTCTIRIENVKATFNLIGQIFSKKEKQFVEITDFDVKLDPAHVEFAFNNLFNGNVRLGEEMNKLLNDNWKDIFIDVKSGYEEALGAIFKSLSNIIFKKVPYNDIFLL